MNKPFLKKAVDDLTEEVEDAITNTSENVQIEVWGMFKELYDQYLSTPIYMAWSSTSEHFFPEVADEMFNNLIANVPFPTEFAPPSAFVPSQLTFTEYKFPIFGSDDLLKFLTAFWLAHRKVAVLSEMGVAPAHRKAANSPNSYEVATSSLTTLAILEFGRKLRSMRAAGELPEETFDALVKAAQRFHDYRAAGNDAWFTLSYEDLSNHLLDEIAGEVFNLFKNTWMVAFEESFPLERVELCTEDFRGGSLTFTTPDDVFQFVFICRVANIRVKRYYSQIPLRRSARVLHRNQQQVRDILHAALSEDGVV